MATIFKVTVGGVELFELTDVQERCADAGVHGIDKGMSQVTDREAAIDSDEMRLFGRKARLFHLRFVAERGHANPAAAAAFVNAHPDAMPLGVGAATVIMGGTTKSYSLASVDSCVVSAQLSRTFTTYDISLAVPA